MNVIFSIVITLAVTCVSGYPNLWSNLNPVHGLYVKPSTDGTTGDLFVAATEENGVKSQWIVDQPINFLPVTAATQPHATAIPLPYTPTYPTPQDESATQKRTVMPSPPVQCAYATPLPTGIPNEKSPVAYPYVYPIPATPTESSTPKCEHPATVPQYPYQIPFHYFYPQMMSAYSNAMSILKDAGLNEDTASSVMTQASPMWPPASYAYPMYVMVDPNTWSQNQATTTSSTPASSSATTTSEENSQA